MSSGQIAVLPKKMKNAKNERSERSSIIDTAVGSGRSTYFGDAKEDSSMEACYQPFDLNERIKELPVLDLDAYLARKRMGKKKKRSGNKKQRLTGDKASKSGLNGVANGGVACGKSQKSAQSAAFKAPQTAVGSQKRKARKESITRRDVSAIMDEVTSIIPMSQAGYNAINGCYILSENVPLPEQLADVAVISNSNYSLCSSSSTSDLLILAEVAANRTELSNL